LDISFYYWLTIGVQIFFFISGYLYGQKEIKDWKQFYKQRLIKTLLPLSILVLIITCVDYFLYNIKYSKLFILANVGFMSRI